MANIINVNVILFGEIEEWIPRVMPKRRLGIILKCALKYF
jgi:hypothetical protein